MVIADEVYDWEIDLMSDEWNAKKVTKLLTKNKHLMVCDGLLNQDIFAGSGNIIRNEVLFRTRLHPETLIKSLPPKKLKELVTAAREYCFDFYRWKKMYQLKKHWLVYKKKKCQECRNTIVKDIPAPLNAGPFFAAIVRCCIKKELS
jgi:endonuclease-8